MSGQSSAGQPARLRLAEVVLHEKPVLLRLPFRFGVVTLTHAPQLFASVRIELPDGRSSWGGSAQILAPKWFDKDPALTNERNFEQLRAAVRLASEAYRSDSQPATPYGLYARHYRSLLEAAAVRHGLNKLTASFGAAMLDAAIVDALGRATGASFYALAQANVLGIEPAALAPDLQGFDCPAWLATLRPAASLHARHTVGLVDVIDGHPGAVNDGLPESLQEVVEAYGHRYFKLKVGGNIEADITRLEAIAAVLDRSNTPYEASLDGNEQYDELPALLELWQRMAASPRLQRLIGSILFIEQPIQRKHALERDVSVLSSIKPVIIDESDEDLDAYPRARALGYRGVSSKLCKGLYKSFINAARCTRWGGLLSGEDLTNQAGWAVQQDLALVNLLGVTHVERNGHHYVNGMADYSEAEQQAVLRAHPDLYEHSHGAVRLKIRKGVLQVGSLACDGFAMAGLATALPPR